MLRGNLSFDSSSSDNDSESDVEIVAVATVAGASATRSPSTTARNTNAPQAAVTNRSTSRSMFSNMLDSSSSSSSIEGILQNLTISNEERQIQKEGMDEFIARELAKQQEMMLDSSSSSESGFGRTDNPPPVSSRCPSRNDLVDTDSDESELRKDDLIGSGDDEHSMSDKSCKDHVDESQRDSPWKCDARTKEVYLFSDGKQWPKLRIPESLFDRLFDYQKDAVEWMASLHCQRIGGVLGDDMGMGKTYMALAYLGGLMRSGTIRNALIVAPKSVLRTWENEASKVLKECVPRAHVQVVNSEMTPKRRLRILQDALECSCSYSSFEQPQLIISTFSLVQKNPQSFSGQGAYWNYVILDEGHTIKNPQSQTHNECHRICQHKETHRLLLTGTPIMNNLTELWSIFDFATSSQVLGALKDFKGYFAKPIEAARDKFATESDIRVGKQVNEELQSLLRPYFLQRLKVDYLKDKLPRKRELVVWTHLSDRQRERYKAFVESRGGVVRSILLEKKSPLEAVTRLKKLCGHPLLEERQNGDNLVQILRESDHRSLICQSAKLGVLLDLLSHFRSNGHRTLVFSQSTKMLDIIEVVLRDICFARIDGSTREKDRQRFVDNFNGEHSSYDIMLLSTKAAGVGLTLTGADRVIVYDPSWNPAEDSQAVDRAYRIGQTKEVLVYRLIAAGTVEEKMYEKQVHKDGIRRMVFTEGSNVERYFNRNELRELFKLAPKGVCLLRDKLMAESKQLPSDWSSDEFSLNLAGVVGVTPHDGFYSDEKADSGTKEPKTPFGEDVAKKAKGRTQRILADETNEFIPLGRNATQTCLKSPPRHESPSAVEPVGEWEVSLVERPQLTVDTPPKDVDFCARSLDNEDSPFVASDIANPFRDDSPVVASVIANPFGDENVENLCSPGLGYERDISDKGQGGNGIEPLSSSDATFHEAPSPVYSPFQTNEDSESNQKIQEPASDVRTSSNNVACICQEATALRNSSQEKRALKLTMGVLTNATGIHGDLSDDEKISLHKEIAESAAALGLLQDETS